MPLLLVASFFLLTNKGTAADGWLPNTFDAQQRVYLDPALSGDPVRPVRLDGLEDKLDKLSAEQGVQYYFVMALKGDGVIPAQYGKEYASWQGDELISRWSGKPGFPASKAVLIILVRSDKNPQAFSFGGNGGSELQRWGFTKNYFTSTLTTIRNQYLPNDPVGYGEAVATTVNKRYVAEIAREKQAAIDKVEREKQAEIDRIEAAQRAERDQIAAAAKAERDAAAHKAFMARLPFYVIGFIVVFGGLGTFLFLFFRFKKAKSQLSAKVAEWEPKMKSAAQLYIKLQTAYLDFISHQKSRRDKFKGETRTRYDAALEAYTDFSIRRELATKLFQQGEEALKGSRFPGVAKLNQAFDDLTKNDVVVSSEDIALKNVTDAYGGTVKKTTLKPDALLANINALFQSCNTAFAGIVEAFDTARTNKTAIETTMTEVEGLKDDLEAVGLNFVPYDPRLAAVRKDAADTLADIASNPIGALADSDRIKASASDLFGDIGTAIKIKKSLADSDKLVTAAVNRAGELRKAASGLAYPFVEGEERTAATSTTLLLNEEGGNPDGSIKEAQDALAAAFAAVLAGENEKAETDKAQAEKAAAAAQATIVKVLEAKAFVEKNVPPVRKNLGVLQGELPPVNEALTALETDFLAANFADQPARVKTAKTTADNTEGNLAVVRKGYQDQRFLAAKAQLERVGGGIQGSRDGLVLVHNRLKELRDLRTHAKKVAKDAAEFSNTLEGKRKAHTFTTAAVTDNAHGSLKPRITALAADVAKQVTDWPAAATTADTVLADLKKVDTAIDDQKKAYDLAKTRVDEVQSAIRTASSECNDNDVRDQAANALEDAKRAVRGLQTTLETAKSDWAALARDAAAKRDVANQARTLAAADKTAAGNARQAISRASGKIDGADRSYSRSERVGNSSGTYGGNVHADLSNANSSYASAQSALRAKKYEDAQRYADTAYRQAEEAERIAAAAVAAAIAAAIAVWEAAERERRRREEEERERERERERQAERERQRERDAQAERDRRSNDSSSSSGWTGGGTDNSSSTGNTGGGTDSNF